MESVQLGMEGSDPERSDWKIIFGMIQERIPGGCDIRAGFVRIIGSWRALFKIPAY